MFKHSDHLLRRTPFGISAIDPDKFPSEPSAAAIQVSGYLLFTPGGAEVGIHGVGVPNVDDVFGDVPFAFEIGSQVVKPKAFSKAAARFATKQVCEYYRPGDDLRFGGHLPTLDKMSGIEGIRRAQLIFAQLAGSKAVSQPRFHAFSVAVFGPPPRGVRPVVSDIVPVRGSKFVRNNWGPL